MRAQEFNIIQMTNSILNTLADWDKKCKDLSNIKLFKVGCKKLILTCIIPLMVMLTDEDQRSQLTPSQISIKKQVLVKWWGTYMTILEDVYLEKNEEDGWSDDKKVWFPKKELKVWEKVWELVETDQLWRIYLSKECCVGNLLFRPFYAKEERSQHCSEILGFMCSKVDCEIAALNNKEDEIGKYVKNFLMAIKTLLVEAMEKPTGKLAKELIFGRFQKNPKLGMM